MSLVIRRKEPHHTGGRYFNDKGPPAQYSGDGAVLDTQEAADAAHRKLREPHLWEILTMREADVKDYGEQKAAARRPVNPLAVALVASAIQAGGPWMGDIARKR